MKRTPPFESLTDPAIAARFDRDLLERLERWTYTVFTVVVDKVDLAAALGATKPDPYHRSVEFMTTRYAQWLDGWNAVGDVCAESRGGNEDQRLKEAFRELIASAQSLHPTTPLGTRLTSRELKVKPKANNLGGLQLADLIAHPAMLACLDRREGRPRRTDYGGKVMQLLDASKYARDDAGRIEGTGRLWIP